MHCRINFLCDTLVFGIRKREGIALHTALLVLQSEDFRFAMKEALQEYFHVIVAQDAASGVALLQESPDILMLDLFLPQTNGLQFLEENSRYIPPVALLFTPLDDAPVLDAAFELGIKKAFMKPGSIAAVLRWLEKQL